MLDAGLRTYGVRVGSRTGVNGGEQYGERLRFVSRTGDTGGEIYDKVELAYVLVGTT